MATKLLDKMAKQLDNIHLRASSTKACEDRATASSAHSARVSSTKACEDGAEDADPFNLRERFCGNQKNCFTCALQEIQAGRKRSCWSWYVFPVSPWVVNGCERGSGTNKQYALRDLPPNQLRADDAARAYLRFPESYGVNLRENYLTIIQEVAVQIEGGISCRSLVGGLDDPKLRSSLRLFERISRGGFDAEVNTTCVRAMAAMDEKMDEVGEADVGGE
jgi:uncharacterized protein (DUF1810 family)